MSTVEQGPYATAEDLVARSAAAYAAEHNIKIRTSDDTPVSQ